MQPLWSMSALAAQLGVDRRTIADRLKDVPACGQLRSNSAWTLKVAVHHICKSTGSADAASQDQDERNRFYDAELKFDKLKKGRDCLLQVDDFKKELGAIIRLITQTFDMYPDLLERDGVLTADQVEAFRGYLDSLMTDLAVLAREMDV
jgi:hypothetical protein